MRGLLTGMLCGVCLMVTSSTNAETPPVLKFKMNSLDGKEVELSKYEGKVLLVVNVASRCGATPQYTQLQALHEKYKDQGLCVLGFPCNQFGSQEPGDSKAIKDFCSTKYHVGFDLFEKIDVNGDDAAPLYKFLTNKETDPKHAGKIGWNFEKFLIGRKGEIIGRFNTGTKPDDPKVVEAIEAALANK